MASRKTYDNYCCTSPEKPRQAPEYTKEGTVEHALLAGAEHFFVEHNEKLRFDLVKRMVQWMMDTDENAFFDEVFIDDHNAFTSRDAMHGLMRSMRGDVMDGHLTDEISILADYLESISEDIPEKYSERHLLLMRSARLYDRVKDRGYDTRGERLRLWFGEWGRPDLD